MNEKRIYRGFEILQSRSDRNLSIKLARQNGQRFLVIISRYIFGVNYRVKYYEFEDEGTAEYVYDRISTRKFSIPSSQVA